MCSWHLNLKRVIGMRFNVRQRQSTAYHRGPPIGPTQVVKSARGGDPFAHFKEENLYVGIDARIQQI